MSPSAAFWKWGFIGLVVASLIVVGQAASSGGLAGLLQVGEDSELRPLIEEQLGSDIPLSPFAGHDGQIYFAIGADLSGDEVPPHLLHPSYRYRRILFSAVSSGFGLLDGRAALAGMVATLVLSTALASGGVAAIARSFGRSDWFALSVVLNPGVWLSVRLATADVVAIALMVAGLLGIVVRRKAGIAAFSLSVLTKEAFLLTPAGLSVSKDPRRWLITAVPAAVLGLWTIWVGLTIDGGVSGETGNLTLPFVGMAEAAWYWPYLDTENVVYLGFAFASVAAALVMGATHRSWLRWSLLAWGVLGACTSMWVWRVGNNAARSVAPILILVVLALVAGRENDPLSDRDDEETPAAVSPSSTAR